MKRDTLLSTLAAANLQPHTFHSPHSDGSFVVTTHGARILGLFTHKDSDNAYFLTPELQNPDSAKTFLAAEHVLGGDRLWIAPERGLFFKGNSLQDGVVTQPS